MSEISAIEKGLKVFTTFLGEMEDFMLTVMKIHPINSLVMMNLMANVGYALIEDENQLRFPGLLTGGIYPVLGDKIKGENKRQRLVAFMFRRSAIHTGDLLKAEVIKDIFSPVGALLRAVGEVVPG